MSAQCAEKPHGFTRPCACNWKGCRQFSEHIEKYAAPNHVWRGKIRWLLHSLSDKNLFEKMILVSAMCKHVGGVKEQIFTSQPRKQLWLARHHFPQAVFKHLKTKRITSLLTGKEMLSLEARDYGNHRLGEGCNTVFQLARRLISKLAEGELRDAFQLQADKMLEKKGQLFICAPCQTSEEVSIIVQSFTSPRTERLNSNDPSLRDKAALQPADSETATSSILCTYSESPCKSKTNLENNIEDCSRGDPPNAMECEMHCTANASADIADSPRSRTKSDNCSENSIEDYSQGNPLDAMECEPQYAAYANAYANADIVDSPDAIESKQLCIEKVKARIHSVGVDLARENSNFAKRMFLIRFEYKSFTPIHLPSQNEYLYPCLSDNHGKTTCLTCRVSRYRIKEGMYCEPCQKERDIVNKKEWKINRGHLSSSCGRRASSLPRAKLVNALQEVRQENAYLKKKIARLKSSLQKYQEREKEVSFDDKSDANKMIQEAFRFAKTDKKTFSATIIESLLQLQQEGEIDSTDGEMREFADYLATEIGNKAKATNAKCRKKTNKQAKASNVRFLPSVINLAMNVFLQSKQSYEALRKNSLVAYPTVRHLQKLKAPFDAKEGDNPSCYAAWLDGMLSKNLLKCRAGHLCVDEIKLKSDLVWNLSDDQMFGFCNVGISPKCLQNRLKEFLSGGDSDQDTTDKTEHVVMANQWRFRSLKNESHTSEYFFNSGNLDSDELLRQLLQVVANYESVGVRIYGVCCDAGGSNEGLFSMFREGKLIKDDDTFLDDDMISMINPFDSERRIWLWHCATHNLKNARNNLWRSYVYGGSSEDDSYDNTSKRKKRLMRFSDKVMFGWEQMKCSYKRQATKRNVDRQLSVEIPRQAIFLDSLMLMNAGYAKAAFSARLLAEISDYCIKQLGIEVNWKSGKGNSDSNQGTGARYRQLAIRFRESLGCRHGEKSRDVLANVCTLEYLAVFHTIFIEKLLNKQWRLDENNIKAEEEKMRDALTFLRDWHLEKHSYIAESPSKKDDVWRPHLLAIKTYRNVRIGISGFFGYAKDVLEREDIDYIPALHSNQSMLESYFGKVRLGKKDCASKYGLSRSADASTKIIDAKGSVQDVIIGKKSRDDEYNRWLNERPNDTKDVPLMQVGESESASQKLFGGFVRDALCSTVAAKGFAQLLLDKTVFPQFAKQAVRSKHEVFYRSIISGTIDGTQFDSECQRLVAKCWACLDSTLAAPANSSYKRSYHYQIYRDLCRGIGPTPIETFSGDRVAHSILYLLLSKLVLAEVNAVLKRKVDDLERPSPRENKVENPLVWQLAQKANINGSVGWALKSIRTRLRKAKWQHTMHEDDADGILKLLDEMCVRESDIVDDAEYLDNYYPYFDRLYNEGGLTLVSPKYIGLAHEILVSISQHVDCSKITKKACKYVQDARENVALTVKLELLPLFLRLSANHDLENDVRKNLFERIVRKTFNARIGAFVRQYKSENLGRGTAGNIHSGIREGLKHLKKEEGKGKKRKR